MNLLNILAAAPGGDFIYDLGKDLSVVALMGFFCRYFMAELKEVRNQQEKDRLVYEEKLERLMERVFKVEESNRDTLNRLSDSVDNLAEKIDLQ